MLHDCFVISFLCLCVSTAGLDIGPLADSSPVAPQSQAGRRTPRTLPEEPLDGILSPELDKMVTDGQCGRSLSAVSSHMRSTDRFFLVVVSESILSKLYKIPGL